MVIEVIEEESMAGLIRINNVWFDPKAIESVISYVDRKSHNHCVKVHKRGGQAYDFGVTKQRFFQLVRESPRSVL
jgi:hypothetical protein